MKGTVLGESIKTLRLQSGVTQKAFAEALNVSSSAVSKWESGQNEPDMETMLKIARYYGISLEALLDGVQEKTEDNSISLDENADSKYTPCRGNRRKWLGIGIALGCIMTVIIAASGTVLWRVWPANSSSYTGQSYSYEIVNGKYAMYEKAYEVFVFYSGEFSKELEEAIITDMLAQWVEGELCSKKIGLIKVICNNDRELAENYETCYPAVIFYLDASNMEYKIIR